MIVCPACMSPPFGQWTVCRCERLRFNGNRWRFKAEMASGRDTGSRGEAYLYDSGLLCGTSPSGAPRRHVDKDFPPGKARDSLVQSLIDCAREEILASEVLSS